MQGGGNPRTRQNTNKIKKDGYIMFIIESGDKDFILQALGRWLAECQKDVRELNELKDKGEEIPDPVIGLIKENCERIEKLSERIELAFEQNVICVDDDVLDYVCDNFGGFDDV